MEQGTVPELSWCRQREHHPITRGTSCCVLLLENERIRMASSKLRTNLQGSKRVVCELIQFSQQSRWGDQRPTGRLFVL